MATVVLAHGAWSAAWSWKKMRPLMAAAGHDFFTPTYTGLGERAHLAAPTNDLGTHIQDVLGVIMYEDLRDVVLLGHSYGGMVATGVADLARDRIRRLIYLDAFVPQDGQSLTDLVPDAQRRRMYEDMQAGDGWRVPPNPTPDDVSDADKAWIADKRLPQSIRCFADKLHLRHGPLTLPRTFIRAARYTHGPFGQFAERARREPGWRYAEIDATHTPNITTPDALMALLDRAIAAG